MNAAVACTILVPLAGGLATSLLGARAARWMTIAAALATLAAVMTVASFVATGGVWRTAVGGWDAPLGIGLRADGIAGVLLVAIACVAGLVTLYLVVERAGRDASRSLAALCLFTWAALDALVLSADIFNLYVTLELVTLAGVGLAACEGDRPALAAALRYLLLALPGSLVYLLGVAVLYGMHGALDLELLGARIGSAAPDTVALALVTAGLCFKAAVFPFHGWKLPVYLCSSPVAAAVLSGLVGKAAYVVLVRLWLGLFPDAFVLVAGSVLGILATAALLWGSLHAMWQPRLTGVIAYSSIAHTGYLFMYFALDTRGALAGGLFIALAHAAASAAMFIVAGIVRQTIGHDRIDGMRGLAHRLPVAFFALALAGSSAMGLPPSGGFVGKWLLVRAAFETQHWWFAVALLIAGLLAAAYTFRVLRGAFDAAAHGERVERRFTREQLVALMLALVSIVSGLVPGLVLEVFEEGAR